MKVIGVVGSRSRNSSEDRCLVEEAIEKLYQDGDSLVSGGCPSGGDLFADLWAQSNGMPVYESAEEGSTESEPDSLKIHPALWDKRGKGAGFYRNTFIARDSDWLIACVSAKRTGGTEDTIKKFLAKGPEFEGRLILV